MEPTGGAAYGSAPSILKCQLLALCFLDPALCISILYATISISNSFSQRWYLARSVNQSSPAGTKWQSPRGIISIQDQLTIGTK
jgi:hypothetical protein